LAAYWSYQYAGYPVLFDVHPDNLADHLLFVEGVGVLWTVPVEVTFYAMFPLLWLVYAASRAVGITLIIAVAGGCFLLPPVYHLMNFLPFFGVGLGVALIRHVAPSNAAFLAALALFFCGVPEITNMLGLPAFGGIWRSPINLIASGALVYTCLSAPSAALIFGNRAMAALGAISYSIYLLHWPVMAALTRNTDIEQTPLLYLATVVSLTLTASTVTYWVIERPLRKTVNAIRFPRRSEAHTSGAMMIAESAPIAASSSSASGSSA
jgi:peptidoglycan/LPS O-acetylase OafA/YrhL